MDKARVVWNGEHNCYVVMFGNEEVCHYQDHNEAKKCAFLLNYEIELIYREHERKKEQIRYLTMKRVMENVAE